MNIKDKFIIVKHLGNIWKTGSPWENLKPTYFYTKKVLTVNFEKHDITFTEKDMTIIVIANPGRLQMKFEIGNARLLNAIEDFVSDFILE